MTVTEAPTFVGQTSVTHRNLLIAVAISATELFGCGRSQSFASSPVDSSSAGDAALSEAGSSNSPGSRRICDGSTAIRLAYREVVGPAAVFVFTPALYELGADFLYVDGQCNYWVQKPLEPHDEYEAWRGYRHGMLTDSQEAALHDLTYYDSFETSPIGCNDDAAVDGTPREYWDGSKVNRCAGSINAPIDWPMRTALYEDGQPVTAAVRIEVGMDRAPDKAPLYTWPLSDEAASFAIDYERGSQFAQTSLISNPIDAAALRAIRDQAIADAEVSPGLFFGLIFVSPKGYAFSMRDDLPFTDPATGMWAPP